MVKRGWCCACAGWAYTLSCTCSGYHPYGAFKETSQVAVLEGHVHLALLQMVPIKVGVMVTVYELLPAKAAKKRKDQPADLDDVSLAHQDGTIESKFKCVQ